MIEIRAKVTEVNAMRAKVEVENHVSAKDIAAIYAISPTIEVEQVSDRDYKFIITDRDGRREIPIPGSGNYNTLTNIPTIEGVEVIGHKYFTDYGLEALTNLEIEELLK